ncbi:hypothetical protein GCM10027447_18490 [Glycomyces halotolerans]
MAETTTTAADLWCTYAAVRTHAWLGRTDTVRRPVQTAEYLLAHRNSDGGYAWSKGMPSDAWATFYCTAALSDLGNAAPKPETTLDWLESTWSGEAYAMMPAQAPEVWATHFSTRTVIEILGGDVPDRNRLLNWLGSLQSADGGLAWSPEHAGAGAVDVRACYYGVAAWRALNSQSEADPPWNVAALTRWLRSMQAGDGGFVFNGESDTPCMWATFRAVGALRMLDAGPARPCTEWILRQRDGDGAFVRWPDHRIADVWAAFCAVGALTALGEQTEPVADDVLRALASMSCHDGGYTYREPHLARDALTVASRALTETDETELAQLRRWLEDCQLPNEGGVMYMPGRGAEIRCTAWALAAGAFQGSPSGRERIAQWLRALQNPDGGFGFWEGRGSDMVSTAAAIEALDLLDRPAASVIDQRSLERFVGSCQADGFEWSNVPDAEPGLRAGLQAQRILRALGRHDPAAAKTLLERHRVRGGGWADTGRRMPDLLSTYEAVATADRFGVPVDRPHLTAFLDRTAGDGGAAWSPLAPIGGDPLADCLHTLLRGRAADPARRLPALTLS